MKLEYVDIETLNPETLNPLDFAGLPLELMVVYLRVSDKKQGDGKESGTGYGIEAQERAVEYYRRQRNGKVLAVFVEVESGTGKRKRPKLQAALAMCEQSGATLVVAKLDRLARNVRFIVTLLDSKVNFICCDMPTADRLMLIVVSAFAEHEATTISKRTKAGLKSAKLKGVKLGAHGTDRDGSPHRDGRGSNAGVKKYLQSKSDEARHYYSLFMPLIKTMRDSGKSLVKIAEHLNTPPGEGHKPIWTTRNGKPWTKQRLSDVIARYMPDENLLSEEAALVGLAESAGKIA